jgi:hypothetical protein
LGHPVTRWTPTAREALLDALIVYVDSHDIPILAEFAFLNHVNRTSLYEFPELSDAIKTLIAKKESALERILYTRVEGSIAGVIFGLKQLGWKDTQSIEHSIPDGITVKYA